MDTRKSKGSVSLYLIATHRPFDRLAVYDVTNFMDEVYHL